MNLFYFTNDKVLGPVEADFLNSLVNAGQLPTATLCCEEGSEDWVPFEKSHLPAKEKICPFCAETIQIGAIKCRFCGSMLDGSFVKKDVVVTGIDPFAAYHTPIQGKKEGKLTILGVVGVVLGLLIFFVGFTGNIGMIMFGAAMAIACWFWARK